MAEEKKKSIRSSIIPIVRAIVVRLLLLVHGGIAIWRTADVAGDLWWLLMVGFAFMLVEGINTVIRRKGQEYKWVCLCVLFYLMILIPGVWKLELDRVDRYEQIANNASLTESLSSIWGISVGVELAPDTWVLAIEQSAIFLIVLSRWILPRGRTTRAELSTLLFVYIGIASDIMEIFLLFDQTEVRNDRIFTYVILAGWSWSMVPFVVVLTAVRSRRWNILAPAQQKKEKGKSKSQCLLVDTEMWSLLVFVLCQDGPFCALRLYALIKYQLFVSSILFFLCKNVLVIAFIFYRVAVVHEELKLARENKSKVSPVEVNSEAASTSGRPPSYSTIEVMN